MTREEAKKVLGEEASEAQITALLNQFHGEKTELEKLKEENKNLRKYEEEVKKIEQEKLTAEEKLTKDKEEVQRNLKEAQKLKNSIKAKSVLIGAGLKEERADELVNRFAREDEEETLGLANDFVKELKEQKEQAIKQAKEELLSLDLKPGASNNPNSSNDSKMTWEKFNSLSIEEQNKFAEESPSEFNNL